MLKRSLCLIGICALVGAKAAWANPADVAPLIPHENAVDVREAIASWYELRPHAATLMLAGTLGVSTLLLARRRAA